MAIHLQGSVLLCHQLPQLQYHLAPSVYQSVFPQHCMEMYMGEEERGSKKEREEGEGGGGRGRGEGGGGRGKGGGGGEKG